jgi:2-C-methyl-D-erythritol 4-phosphate cytidylyltransferase
MKAAAIIPAAGSGTRMGGTRKAFLELQGKPLLQYCLESFFQVDVVTRIVVALSADDADSPPSWLKHDRVSIVRGGSQRAESVRAGLDALPDDIDVVVVHDAARPLVTPEMIRSVIDLAASGTSAIVALPVTDTLHEVDDVGIVTTVDRSRFWRAQTPQAFPREALELGYARVEDFALATDEAGLVASAGFTVKVIPGAAWNIKITTPEDVVLAEAALAGRAP